MNTRTRTRRSDEELLVEYESKAKAIRDRLARREAAKNSDEYRALKRLRSCITSCVEKKYLLGAGEWLSQIDNALAACVEATDTTSALPFEAPDFEVKP